MNNKLFIYGVEPSIFEKLKEKITICKVYAIDDSVLESTVHEVVDIPYMNYVCSKKEHAFMILDSEESGFVWKQIIDAMKPMHLQEAIIKVSVTPNNRKWPVRILFEHVLEEDQIFHAKQQLRQMMIQASAQMMDKLTDDFQTVLTYAFKTYDDGQVSLSVVNDAIEKLKPYCEVQA